MLLALHTAYWTQVSSAAICGPRRGLLRRVRLAVLVGPESRWVDLLCSAHLWFKQTVTGSRWRRLATVCSFLFTSALVLAHQRASTLILRSLLAYSLEHTDSKFAALLVAVLLVNAAASAGSSAFVYWRLVCSLYSVVLRQWASADLEPVRLRSMLRSMLQEIVRELSGTPSTTKAVGESRNTLVVVHPAGVAGGRPWEVPHWVARLLPGPRPRCKLEQSGIL